MTNNDNKKMLIDYTTYHYNSMENPSFTKDAVKDSFKAYENKKLHF